MQDIKDKRIEIEKQIQKLQNELYELQQEELNLDFLESLKETLRHEGNTIILESYKDEEYSKMYNTSNIDNTIRQTIVNILDNLIKREDI